MEPEQLDQFSGNGSESDAAVSDQAIEAAVAAKSGNITDEADGIDRWQFEDMTLVDLLGFLILRPFAGWRMLHAVTGMPRVVQSTTSMRTGDALPGQSLLPPTETPAFEVPDFDGEIEEYSPIFSTVDERQSVLRPADRLREGVVFAFRLAAFLVVWAGNGFLEPGSRGGTPSIGRGVAFMLLGIVIWVGVEIFVNRDRSIEQPENRPSEDVENQNRESAMLIHPLRIFLAVTGVAATFLMVLGTSGNQFTLIGFFAWMVSIVAFSGAVASDEALFERDWLKWQIQPFWKSGTFYALIVIMLVAGYFRLNRLEQTPPQMTSDHVEKLLDSQRVLDGNQQVFFPNNGGREPFQMYAMALLTQLPGLRMDFVALKALSVIEGLITIPVLWWMAREVIGRDNRELGNIVGIIIAALVAVSHWHVSLSRLGLRIILTVLIAALILIFLGRGMRDNRRDDYLRAGLILGAGLYMYQAVRMLPIVIVIGVLIAIVYYARRRADWWQYAINFFTLVFISFVVFVPMFTFSVQFRDLFWRRTTGRLLGDALIQEVAEDGTITMRDPSVAEQIQAFQDNLPVLWNNVRNVVLMFNWKGDVAWINNAPNTTQMDTIVGALFVLGMAAWVIRLIKTRDAVDFLVPVMLFIMLMPSALAIAYPVENPSATRTSGALPVAYMLAAYPLALMIRSLMRAIPVRSVGIGAGVMMVGLVMAGSYVQNAHTYFDLYHNNYLLSSLPHRQGGDDLEAFVNETSAKGNAFMIAYPYWWDHRALAIEGGMIDWPNGIVNLASVPMFMRDSYNVGGEYGFDPESEVLFFFATADEETFQQLPRWFPGGEFEFIEISEQLRDYAMYRAPAIGQAAFDEFVTTYVDS